MKIISRSEWGARPSKADVAHQPLAAIAEVFVHHSAQAGGNVRTQEQAAAVVRGIQAFHMDTKGWSDIGYHYVVVQNRNPLGRAWIFAGRDLTTVPAAQLNHNFGTVAICVHQLDPEPLRQNTRWRVGRLARRIRQASVLRGHYEVFATECPGTVIRAQLAAIARIAGLRRS